MDHSSQPNPDLFVQMHDDFQNAGLRFRHNDIESKWSGPYRRTMIRRLSLGELIPLMEIQWNARMEFELGAFIAHYVSGVQPATVTRDFGLSELCGSMMGLQLMDLENFSTSGQISSDSSSMLGRIRNETSDIHLLIYFKMLEHIALNSQDPMIWKSAMVQLADIENLGQNPRRQEMASLCLERIMLLEGQQCGRISRSEAESYAEEGENPGLRRSIHLLPSREFQGCIHKERYDFARLCLAEGMLLFDQKVQASNLKALALSMGDMAIGPMLALCLSLSLRRKGPQETRGDDAELIGLISHHLSQAHTLLAGDSDTLPAIAAYLRNGFLQQGVVDSGLYFAGYNPLGSLAIERAHYELARLLDPKDVFHPHPLYEFRSFGDCGMFVPRLPRAGLHQSAIMATTELALAGYRPAASTLMRAVLELTGPYIPERLSKLNIPLQVRDNLPLIARCIESLAKIGIPGAKEFPDVFIHGSKKVSELEDLQVAALSVSAMELLRINSSIMWDGMTPMPVKVAYRVIDAQLGIRSTEEQRSPTYSLEDLIERRKTAFGGDFRMNELPETSDLASIVRTWARPGNHRTDPPGQTPACPLIVRRQKT